MSNQWLRLWHDMPNDPKWRTIARVSGQPISVVIAVYLHVLVVASNATERGRTHSMCSEDIASALDVQTSDIELVLSAMQGRVMEGDMVSGWDERQRAADAIADRANLRLSSEVWRLVRSEVFARDDYRCTYCNRRGVRLECDHIHPIARGGSNDLSNLTTACFACNRSKRDKLLSEWRKPS